MKKYFFRFGIALLTFGIGNSLLSPLPINLFLYKPFAEDKIKKDSVEQILQAELSRSLTFEQTHGMSCGNHPSSKLIYKASDGAEILSTSIHNLKSEKQARKKFQQYIKNASKIIEVSPYLDYWKRKLGEKAVIESGGKVLIIKYYPKDSPSLKENFYITILETPTLRHVLAFEEQEESFYRSLIINKLKP